MNYTSPRAGAISPDGAFFIVNLTCQNPRPLRIPVHPAILVALPMNTLKSLLLATTSALGLAVAPALRADYTAGLLVGWTFNNGSLTSDLGSMSPVTFTETGVGGSQTTTFNADGTVSLGAGRLLVASGINDSALPDLSDGFTLWVRMRRDTVGTNNAVLFGLSSTTTSAAGFDNRTATLELVSSSSNTVRFYGRTDGGTALARASGFSTIAEGEFVDVAIRVSDLGTNSSIYNDWVNGTVLQGTWPGSTADLQSIAALALGRLNSNGGVGLTFDEVRLYGTVLTDAQLASISPIPEPASTASLAAAATLGFAALRRRRR